MREDFFWALFGGGFIMFWAVLLAVVRHFQAARRLREREMVHQERMLSLEKGTPLPEAGAGSAASPATLRSLFLAAGLLLFFGGLGTGLALYLGDETRSSTEWSLGLIPSMAGLGLLLHFWISQRIPIE